VEIPLNKNLVESEIVMRGQAILMMDVRLVAEKDTRDHAGASVVTEAIMVATGQVHIQLALVEEVAFFFGIGVNSMIY